MRRYDIQPQLEQHLRQRVQQTWAVQPGDLDDAARRGGFIVDPHLPLKGEGFAPNPPAHARRADGFAFPRQRRLDALAQGVDALRF